MQIKQLYVMAQTWATLPDEKGCSHKLQDGPQTTRNGLYAILVKTAGKSKCKFKATGILLSNVCLE